MLHVFTFLSLLCILKVNLLLIFKTTSDFTIQCIVSGADTLQGREHCNDNNIISIFTIFPLMLVASMPCIVDNGPCWG